MSGLLGAPASPVRQLVPHRSTNGYANRRNWFLNGSYSWIVPAGVTQIKTQQLGAGGSAGNDSTTHYNNAGSGGAFAEKTWTVSPGDTVTIVVGAGGAGVTANTDGNNGGSTTVTVNAVTVASNGGPGGPHNNVTRPTAATATGGDINTSGGQGGQTDGTNASSFPGGGSSGSPWGNGYQGERDGK